MRNGFIRKKVQKAVSKTGVQIRNTYKITQTGVPSMLSHVGITKKYGRTLTYDRFLIVVFVIAFIVMYTTIFLLPPLAGSDNTTGTIISLVGVFIGTYIAIWLINQKHIKTIEENFFYKMQILLTINSTLRSMSRFNDRVEGTIDMKKREAYNKDKYMYKDLFSRYEEYIILANSNTLVPVDTRNAITAMLLQIYGFIEVSLNEPQLSFIMMGKKLPTYQNTVFNSEYFTTDCDEQVQAQLKELKNRWSTIKQL